MDFRNFIAGENDDERRLDRVIRHFLKDAALSEIYKYIRKGLIKVNDKKTKADFRVKSGDKISVAEVLFTSKTQVKSGAEFCNIDISEITVFQNEHILILDKPYDIKVHGANSSLDAIVKKYYEDNFASSSASSLSFAPGPLHRLDRKTTGLIAFSMSLKGAKWFSENIKSHSIKKIYTGIVQGKMTETERWEDFISKTGDTQKAPSSSQFKTVRISESKSGPDGKLAVTHAKPLKCGKYSGSDITLCEFEIETGRTHQIRSQAALHGFPLLGDTAYGGKRIISERDFYLHAEKLIFPENNLGLPESIVSNPYDFFVIFSNNF